MIETYIYKRLDKVKRFRAPPLIGASEKAAYIKTKAPKPGLLSLIKLHCRAS